MARRQMPVGLQLWSVREAAKQDFFGVLAKVAAMGYAGVETAGFHDKKPAEIRTVLDGLGLVATSAHMALPTPETLQQTVDAAGALGFDIVIAGKGSDEFKTADSIKAVAESFQKSAASLKPFGIRLGYHNHWWEFARVDGRLAYDILMEAAPDLYGQLDMYWASNFGANNVPEIVARYKSRLPLLHVKDGPLVKDQPHTALGKGKMNIPACIQAADDAVTKWLIVELDSCATDMMTAVKESCAWLTGKGLAKGRK